MRKSLLAAAIASAVLAGCAPFAFNQKGYTYNEVDLLSAWSEVASKIGRAHV